MIFNKYKERGAYHWDLYGTDPVYTSHVDKVCKWVKPGLILDIGAGDGLITYMLGVHGIDDNKVAVQLAQERGANVTIGSAYNLSGKYNAVLMLDVLEHLERPTDALDEARSVLMRGGLLYIVTPPAKKGGVHDKYHYAEYTEFELKKLLRKSGFKCVILETVHQFVRMYGTFI